MQAISSLLKEVEEAADPRTGTLYCYSDLQDLLAKLATATESLLAENARLSGRLRRNDIRTAELPSIGSVDPGGMPIERPMA